MRVALLRNLKRYSVYDSRRLTTACTGCADRRVVNSVMCENRLADIQTYRRDLHSVRFLKYSADFVQSLMAAFSRGLSRHI